jgi:hypothetical protein
VDLAAVAAVAAEVVAAADGADSYTK